MTRPDFDRQFAETESERSERWRRIKAERKAAGRCWQCNKPVRECWCFAEPEALEPSPTAIDLAADFVTQCQRQLRGAQTVAGLTEFLPTLSSLEFKALSKPVQDDILDHYEAAFKRVTGAGHG